MYSKILFLGFCSAPEETAICHLYHLTLEFELLEQREPSCLHGWPSRDKSQRS